MPATRAGINKDGFTAGVLLGVLPLLIWATHFFGSYAAIEFACALDLQRFTLARIPVITVFLWVFSAVELAALALLVMLAVRNGKRDAEGGGTLAFVRIGAAALALVGVLWATVPMTFTPACVNLFQ